MRNTLITYMPAWIKRWRGYRRYEAKQNGAFFSTGWVKPVLGGGWRGFTDEGFPVEVNVPRAMMDMWLGDDEDEAV